MKKYLLTSTVIVLGAYIVSGQTTMRDIMLKERKEFSDRTLFQQFEDKMAPTADERKEKMQRNKARRELLLTIIDTTQIKFELKQKLIYDVVHNPFSKRLKKFMDKHSLKEKVLLSN
jgi:hypothetical protein